MVARPPSPSNPYFAPLPPITPASYGLGPNVLHQHRRRRRILCLHCPSWRAFKTYAPVCLVFGLLLYPYIPFVYLLALRTSYIRRHRPWLALYQLLAFHGLLALALWALGVVFWTPAGSPTDGLEEGRAARDEEQGGDEGFEMVGREEASSPASGGDGRAAMSPSTGLMAKASTGGQRFCKKCGVGKPDRCHHCSSCGRCILKMDHHCLWLGTCVGFANYRAFLLFLSYVALYATFVGVEAGRTVWGYFDDEEALAEVGFTPVSHVLLILDGVAFGLSIGGFAAFHWYLALSNKTTLESLDGSRTAPSLALPPSPTQTTAFRWRPDHVLSARERRAARWQATEEGVNVWDVGWRANLASLAPAPPPFGGGGRAGRVVRWLKPSPVGGSGKAFASDPEKVRVLLDRTRRVRLGEQAATRATSLAVPGPGTDDNFGVRSLSTSVASSSSSSCSSDDDGSTDNDEERRLVGSGRRRVGNARSARGGQGSGRGWDTRTWRADVDDRGLG